MMALRTQALCGFVALVLVALVGCGGKGGGDGAPTARAAAKNDPWSAPEPRPERLERSRYGNPREYVVFGKRYRVRDSARDFVQTGNASWYGKKFHGRRTSSGEPFDMYALTAAHRELPIPVIARVTRLDNGKSVVVRINDRGPFHADRIIDLSWAAAVRLDMVADGTARVRVEVLESAEREAPAYSIDAESRAAAQPRYQIAETVPVAGDPANPSPRPEAMFLQVGAFRDVTAAQRRRQEMQAMGYPVFASSPTSGGWFRIWLGPWSTTADAERTAESLRQQGIDSLLVAQ